MSSETSSETISRVHDQLAPVIGGMSLSLARGGCRRSDIRDWAERAERAAQDLRELSNRLEKR